MAEIGPLLTKELLSSYSDELELYDYIYERYHVDFSVCLILINSNIEYDINFPILLRKTDKYIKINDKYHFVLFFGLSEKEAYNAIMSLEKKLLRKYNLFDIPQIFKAYLAGKNENRSIQDLIDICFRLSKNDYKDVGNARLISTCDTGKKYSI